MRKRAVAVDRAAFGSCLEQIAAVKYKKVRPGLAGYRPLVAPPALPWLDPHIGATDPRCCTKAVRLYRKCGAYW